MVLASPSVVPAEVTGENARLTATDLLNEQNIRGAVCHGGRDNGQIGRR